MLLRGMCGGIHLVTYLERKSKYTFGHLFGKKIKILRTSMRQLLPLWMTFLATYIENLQCLLDDLIHELNVLALIRLPCEAETRVPRLMFRNMVKLKRRAVQAPCQSRPPQTLGRAIF